MQQLEFVDACKQKLNEYWTEISELDDKETLFISDDLRKVVNLCINNKTKTYRYVLPTQLLAKICDPKLDSRSLMAASKLEGAFDARSICHKIIVPFDKTNEDVLGGSPEPYVNNPLRVHEITTEHLDQQKDKYGWKCLCSVLDKVETKNDPKFTELVFKQVLLAIYHRLSEISVKYPIPIRISLKSMLNIIDCFLNNSSGGEHPVVITFSLFKIIGEKFNIYDDVIRQKINASDSSTGMISDIQCMSSNKVVLSIEVKDKDLTIEQIKSKLTDARTQQVANLLFMVQKGISEEQKINLFIDQEFSSGQNIFIFEIIKFITPILVVLGENGRKDFIKLICETLDNYSDIKSRRLWAKLLSEI